jgi:hypothetical protein
LRVRLSGGYSVTPLGYWFSWKRNWKDMKGTKNMKGSVVGSPSSSLTESRSWAGFSEALTGRKRKNGRT